MSERHPIWLATTVIAVIAGSVLLGDGVRWENIERGVSRFVQDASSLRVGVKQFHQYLDAYPEGENAAIMKALRGGNSKRMAFLELPKENLNLAGEIIDAQGTPCQIHRLPATSTVPPGNRTHTFSTATRSVFALSRAFRLF